MKKIFKKSVAAVVAVTLVTSPVRADFFSDFCGAIFTILTCPIALIAPDNPTLRKNNPFRKKLWQIEAEREEREEQILQRYSKQIPNAPVVAPAPEPVVPQIPIGQITEIVLAEVQKRLPKKSEPQIPIDQITETVLAEVQKRLPKPQEKSLTIKDVTDIVLAQVPKLVNNTRRQLTEIAEYEVKKHTVAVRDMVKDIVGAPITNTSLTMPQLNLAMDSRIQKYHNATVAPLLRPVKYQEQSRLSGL